MTERFVSVDVSEFDREPEPEAGRTPEPWVPVPVTEAAAESPAILPAYGRGLIYDSGAMTLVSGEPGVGKSMFITTVIADAAIDGNLTLYIDFERGPGMLMERLEATGLSRELIAERVLYLRPKDAASPAAIEAMVEALKPAIITTDSYDAALALFGLEPSNEDLRAFEARVIDPLRYHGAALLAPDHVTKNREQRGRYSIGGQAKLAIADAHLGLTSLVPLRRGGEGKLKVKVHKDNHGGLPLAAVFTLRSDEATGELSWDVRPEEADAGDESTFRPTLLMARVSAYLAPLSAAVPRSEIKRNVKGKDKYIDQAIDALIREGFAEEEPGSHGARLVRLVKLYRENE